MRNEVRCVMGGGGVKVREVEGVRKSEERRKNEERFVTGQGRWLGVR